MTAVVLARWAASDPTSPGKTVACDECHTAVTAGAHCPGCGQLATPGRVGMLATATGDGRIVIARRSPDGTWAPAHTLTDNPQARRQLARQHRTAAVDLGDHRGGQP